MSEAAHGSVVRAFIESFNSQDLDAFVATLHSEVEIIGGRGSFFGPEEARTWATFKPGGLQQRQVVDQLIDCGECVLALNRRQWFWDGTDELAAEEEMAYVFTLRDGLIARWEPFEDRAQARRVAGLLGT